MYHQTFLRRGECCISHTYSVAHQQEINNILRKWNFPLCFSKAVMNHMVHFIDGVMTHGFSGTLTDIHRESCHSRNRRTLSHFLSHGKWDENYLMRIIQEKTWKMIQQEAKRTEEPIFIIIDDTVCEKTKPSSQAMYPYRELVFIIPIQKENRYGGMRWFNKYCVVVIA